MHHWISSIQRGLRKPPHILIARIAGELRAEFERFTVRRRSHFSLKALLYQLEANDLDGLWHHLGDRPYPALSNFIKNDVYDLCCPADRHRILDRAEDALAHKVELLGSGKVELGKTIEWLKDFKTGISWPVRYYRDIEYNNRGRPSDVKIPWELSRLQWLIPAGQAYLLTGDEKYAQAVRNVLEHWIEENPYAVTVNWACTMEVAIRIFTWTWFFHVFHKTKAWDDSAFREKFLRTLYLHVVFTERHIERSDVNGNHYTADATGLLFGGLFFGRGKNAERWQRLGWAILLEEIQRQVFPDGVDFEASVAYHRLVTEFFLIAALYRTAMGMPVETTYRERLIAMAHFSACYSKPDGSSPLWGDADDGRALPFGGQNINDHRYLIGLVGLAFNRADLVQCFNGSREEVFWLLGKDATQRLPSTPRLPSSTAFPDGGFYVMRGEADHLFIDCGPVGLAGRGGHGHNDCLSFEAVLDRIPLISDSGAYLYTASYKERNAFRSTSYHNTPQVDGEEINRFIRPDYLWNLEYDAAPHVLTWQVSSEHALFIGEHHGYRRLSSPVTPKRTILLDFSTHSLFIEDCFDGRGIHSVTIPLHLAPGVEVAEVGSNELILKSGPNRFDIWWKSGSTYKLAIEDCRVSPSYGVVLRTKKLVWRRETAPLRPLALFISPDDCEREAVRKRVSHWLSRI